MVGKTVSHYRVLEELGGGDRGVVYKAEDIDLGRPVALKFLPEVLSGDKQALERFLREARAAAALHHPNICTLYEIGQHQGQPFIVMEFLEGQTLKRRIGGRPLPTDTLLDLAIQVANGLSAAHSKEIVHRDLKPTNIFVSDDGQAKILDFGLANLAKSQPPSPTVPNTTAEATGAVAYISPEQIRGERVNARTDIFSLGAILYEMATGRPTFSGSSRAEATQAILHRAPTPPTQVNPELPYGLESIINTALEKDSKLRYQTAADLRNYLVRLKQDKDAEPAVAPMDASVPPSSPKTFWKVSGAAMVFLALVFVVAILVFPFANPCTPTQFLRGEPMLLGNYRLTVSSVADASSGGEEMQLSVFYKLDQVDFPERKWWQWPWFGKYRMARPPKFTLLDREGNKYRRDWRVHGGRGENYRVFTVPRKSHGFTLIVQNPEPRPGQPCSAAVSLGR